MSGKKQIIVHVGNKRKWKENDDEIEEEEEEKEEEDRLEEEEKEKEEDRMEDEEKEEDGKKIDGRGKSRKIDKKEWMKEKDVFKITNLYHSDLKCAAESLFNGETGEGRKGKKMRPKKKAKELKTQVNDFLKSRKGKEVNVFDVTITVPENYGSKRKKRIKTCDEKIAPLGSLHISLHEFHLVLLEMKKKTHEDIILKNIRDSSHLLVDEKIVGKHLHLLYLEEKKKILEKGTKYTESRFFKELVFVSNLEDDVLESEKSEVQKILERKDQEMIEKETQLYEKVKELLKSMKNDEILGGTAQGGEKFLQTIEDRTQEEKQNRARKKKRVRGKHGKR